MNECMRGILQTINNLCAFIIGGGGRWRKVPVPSRGNWKKNICSNSKWSGMTVAGPSDGKTMSISERTLQTLRENWRTIAKIPSNSIGLHMSVTWYWPSRTNRVMSPPFFSACLFPQIFRKWEMEMELGGVWGIIINLNWSNKLLKPLTVRTQFQNNLTNR